MNAAKTQLKRPYQPKLFIRNNVKVKKIKLIMTSISIPSKKLMYSNDNLNYPSFVFAISFSQLKSYLTSIKLIKTGIKS